MNACPICKTACVPETDSKCPQCNSDLACFSQLDRLCAITDGLRVGKETLSAQKQDLAAAELANEGAHLKLEAPKKLNQDLLLNLLQGVDQKAAVERRFFFSALAFGNFALIGLALVCFWIWTLHQTLHTKLTALAEATGKLSHFQEQLITKNQVMDEKLAQIERQWMDQEQSIQKELEEVRILLHQWTDGRKSRVHPARLSSALVKSTGPTGATGTTGDSIPTDRGLNE